MAAHDGAESRFRSPSSELAREVLIHGPVARGDLSLKLGMSLATITRMARPLLDSGLLIEVAEFPDGAVGRPARPLDVRADALQFIGIKLTGDAAVAITTDLRANEGRSAERPLPDHDVSSVVEIIEELVRELANDQPFAAIGISVGGVVSHQRVVERAAFLGWHSVRLADEVEKRLGIPAIVENDVVALTAAEHWFGLARGLPNFAVITIGAGVGYGLVMHDLLVSTSDTGLGRGIHFPIDAAGPWCQLGHRGCATSLLAIPNILAQLEAVVGVRLTYQEVLDLAREGHPVAGPIVRNSAAALGHLIATVANTAMVEHVVLAGEGLGILSVAEAEMRAAVRSDRDAEAGEVKLLIDDEGFISWARAAAAIAIRRTVDTLTTS